MPSRQRKLNLARRVQGFGGLLLATSFFLPTNGCAGPLSTPAEVAADWISDPGFQDIEGYARFILLVAPYLFGLLTLFIAFGFVSRNRSGEQIIGWSIALLLAGAASAVISLMFLTMWHGYLVVEEPAILTLAAAAVASMYLLTAVTRGREGFPHIRWCCSVCCCLPFWELCWLTCFSWLLNRGVEYGPFVSFAGAVLIGAGAYAEVKIRCGKGWLAALGLLATCRLRPLPPGEPRCSKCTYLLIGLTVERCPECGQAFRWSDFASLEKD